jgi:Ca2+-binding RTX toxin-like protein
MNFLEYYEYAKLSAATYTVLDGELLADIARLANVQKRVPEAVANQTFVAGSEQAAGQPVWTIPPGGYYGNDSVGFAATLFQRGTEKVLAIRGTEPDLLTGELNRDLLKADLRQLGEYGMAISQAVSLFNYVQCLMAPSAQTDVMQLQFHSTLIPPTPAQRSGDYVTAPGIPPQFLWVTKTYIGKGLGELINYGDNLTITGHSLGGHLAAIGARLFPSLFRQAVTFNAPGYDPVLGLSNVGGPLFVSLGKKLTDEFINILFAPNLVDAPAATFDGHVITVESEDAIPGDDGDGVSGNATGNPFSPEIYITTEKVTHDIGHLMDGLGIQALLARMDSTLTTAQAGKILEAITATTGETYELLLEKLHKAIVGTPLTLPPTEPSWTKVDGGEIAPRRAYYVALVNLENQVKANPALRLESLLGKSAAALQSAASDAEGIAYRHALQELNPFAILGADYSVHETSLALYDSATGKGLSNQWIEDRVKFLAAANTGRGNDSVSGTTLVASPTAADSMLYKDLLLGIAVRNGQTVLDSQRITFGSEFGDTLKGGNKSDRLYGAAGADTLTGGAAADYLEGGTDDDVLHGGAGSDTYWIGRDGGTDTVLDSDGQGRIVLNGTTLEGTLTRDATDRSRYHYATDPALIIRHIGAEGMKGNLVIVDPRGDKAKVMVMDWASGELGLTLSNTPATPIVRPLTLAGDLLPIDHDISTPEENLGYDVLGNVDVTLTAAPNRADTLYGSAGNDLIQGFGGDDWINTHGGEDRLEGGTGSDVINAGNDNDLLIGGSDADLMHGGSGDDRLFADAEIELADVDAQTGGSGRELLAGGEGDDTLVGAATSDALLGGAGDDVILGGAGDDDLVGDRDVTIATRDWSLTRSITTEGDLIRYRHTYANFTSSGEAAQGGADVIYGGAGNDWLMAGAGDDLLDGGADADILFGQAGHDVLDGGTGDDVLNGDEIDDGTANGLAGSLHGSDWLDGGDGADTLTGNGGADELYGGTGNDQIAGDDTTTSGQYHGADYLDGEDGNDRLWGNGGEDSLFGGVGNDHLEGDESRLAGQYHGADYLDGEAGDDELVGGGGSDTLYGSAGDDVLAGDDTADAPLAAQYHGNDILDGGDGSDKLNGNGGNDTLTGGTGADYLDGGAGDDSYVLNVGDGATAANGAVEAIFDQSGKDTLRFGAGISLGNLTLGTANGGSVLVIDYGPQDRLAINDGMRGAVERLEFADGMRLSYSELIGRLMTGTNTITAADGSTTALGGTSDDTIAFGGGRGTFSGGRGNDTLIGSGGNNTYLYSTGDGTDHISDTSAKTIAGAPAPNTLRFGAGITAADITLGLGSLLIRVGSDPNDAIHIDGFNPDDALASQSIDRFEFDDGSVLTHAELLGQGFDIAGTAGNDLLLGTSVTDRMAGGAGNDLLLGGAGDDRYRFNSGDGQDVIQDIQGLNTVEFGAGLTAAGMTATQSMGDDGQRYLDLDFGNGDRLSILDGELGRVGSFVFADATLDMAQMLARLPMVNLRGGGGDETFAGFGGDDLIDGGAGNDVITGGDGADRLYGGLGNDVLQGDADADLLDGGAGNDTLAGGSGIDTYRFGLGLGQDAVVDTAGEASVLELMAGTNAFTLTARQDGDDLVLAARMGSDAIRLTGYYADPDAAAHWTVKTADGVTRDMSTFLQGVGEQVSTGSEFIAQFRQRWVGEWNAWHVSNGYTIGDDGVARRAQSLMTTVGTTTVLRSETESVALNAGDFLTGDGADTYGGHYSFAVANSFSWPTFESNTIQSSSTTTSSVIREAVLSSRTALEAWDQPQPIVPTEPFFIPLSRLRAAIVGHQIPYGSTQNVTDSQGRLIGMWVNPQTPPTPPQPTEQTVELRKEMVDISRVYTTPISYLGGGDDVVAGFNLDGGSGNDLLAINSDGPARYSYVGGKKLPVFLYGNDGNDYLRTAGESEIGFYGEAVLKGETFMIGGRGRDWLQGGNGRTVFMLLEEDSIDTIMSRGGSAKDEVVFGPGVTAESLRVLRAGELRWDGPDEAFDPLYGELGPWHMDFLQLLAPDGTGAIVHIANPPTGGAGIEIVSFSDGARLTVSQLLARLDDSQTVNGSTGDDTLVLGAGNDVIDGGSGNDVLVGGAGNDVYHFGRGSGQDVIDQSGATAIDIDVLRFADDVLPSDVRLFRDDRSLSLEIAGTEDFVTLKSWYDDSVHSISAIEFADGTRWSADEISVPVITGTDGADSLNGTRGDDTMDGGAGDDALYGGSGKDILLGGVGRDSLHGGSGDDVLSAQGGGGYANGGPGDDTYLFDRGDGLLTVDLRSVTLASGDVWESNVDVVRFGAGIAPEDVVASFSMTRGRLSLGLAGSSDAIELRGWQDSNSSQIARFEFADGTVWTADTIPFQFIAGTDGDDVLTGTAGDDAIFGRRGNDVVSGRAGDDTLFGGDGYNVLYGEAGDDFLNAGDGGYLVGGLGNDTYLFNRGGGDVTIDQYLAEDDDSGGFAGAGDIDVIRFGVGVAASEIAVSFSEAAGSLSLSIAYSIDAIHIQGWQDANTRQIARFEFADGTFWTADTMPTPVITGTDGDDSLSGSAGDDRLDGGAGNDILSGGEGNNSLVGGEGDDTFFADASAGVDHIGDSGGVDTLVLEGASLGDVRLGVGSLKITANSTGREIHIDDFDPDDPYAEGGVEFFHFADGAILSKSELIGTLGFHPTGTSGNDLLSGTSLNDVITGLAGDDTLIGGRGDDSLDGGVGDDTYVFSAGGGSDTIVDTDGIDSLVFAADISVSDVSASRTGSQVTLSVSATDSVSFAETAPGQYSLEAVSFADGATWQASDILQRVNLAPTGSVEVSGTAARGQTLIASHTLADADGLGAIGYQWQSSVDGETWTAVAGATADSFTPGAEHVGQQVRVNASYTDGHGSEESVASSATLAVTGANRAPTVAIDIPDQAGAEDLPFAYSIALGSFADLDAGDALTYTASLSNGAELPSWLGFDAATQTLSGTPGPSAAALLNVRVTATDSAGESASDEFALEIANHLVGSDAADSIVGTHPMRDLIEGLDQQRSAERRCSGNGRGYLDRRSRQRHLHGR